MNVPVSRDLTVFGGKTQQLPTGESVSFPYFLPFSKPLRSLITADKFLSSTDDLFDFNDRFVRWLEEKRGSELRISDLTDRKYGKPHSSLRSMQEVMEVPDRSARVRDYLAHVRGLLASHVDLVLEEAYGV